MRMCIILRVIFHHHPYLWLRVLYVLGLLCFFHLQDLLHALGRNHQLFYRIYICLSVLGRILLIFLFSLCIHLPSLLVFITRLLINIVLFTTVICSHINITLIFLLILDYFNISNSIPININISLILYRFIRW